MSGTAAKICSQLRRTWARPWKPRAGLNRGVIAIVDGEARCERLDVVRIGGSRQLVDNYAGSIMVGQERHGQRLLIHFWYSSM